MNNNTVYVTPPPSGGVITAFILNILKGYNFTSDSIATEENKVLTYHRFIEAYKYGEFAISILSCMEKNYFMSMFAVEL